ncbi:hypothetical protein CORC01_12757 [Colletotrichum orchidophilum]|uniref:C2H2-type domain-containing protein n=1 Tax=Colletotrichum orchidophilum TaxID=1209926 RepID=A0A1G4AS40_9PEZI|nr:uncharacterized protein CORC01_12757 [Colletotrichum orchidophilum]OHE91969.1 hypothetical protein CORC01_12757 [Colletotrichum orchidophilum]
MLKEHLLRRERLKSSSGREMDSVSGRERANMSGEPSPATSRLSMWDVLEMAPTVAFLSSLQVAAITQVGDKNPVKAWYRIWDIIFPGEQRPDSPYVESGCHSDKKYQCHFDKYQSSRPPVPDPRDCRRRHVSEFDEEATSYLGGSLPFINPGSGHPPCTTSKATTPHRDMSDLVFEALRDLENRLAATRCRKTSGQKEGKAPSRKRGRQSGSQQQEPPSKRHMGSRNQQRGGSEERNEHPDEDDPDGSDPEDNDDSSGSGNAEERFLACPLYRKDPEKHPTCAMLRLGRIRDLKQHMRRRHNRPEFYCPICWEIFSGPEQRDSHLVQRSCHSVDESGPPWITREQDALLEGRVPNGSTEDQWFSVWDIVCPGQRRPRPAFSFLGKMVEDTSTIRRELWEEDGRHIVENLVAQREALLQQPLTAENRRLVRRCIMDAVAHVLEHPDVTQAGPIRWHRGDEGGDGHSAAAAAAVPESENRAHGGFGGPSDMFQHQVQETHDSLFPVDHTRIAKSTCLVDGVQLDESTMASWWDFLNVQSIDGAEMSFCNALSTALGDGHDCIVKFADVANGADG